MIEIITSPHNPLIKLVTSLAQKKYRQQTGLFVAEGIRLAEELAAAGWPLEACILSASVEQTPRAQDLVRSVSSRTRVVKVSDEIFQKIADTEQPQGLLLLAGSKQYQLSDLPTRTKAFLLVLDTIQDPGNIGALIRTADAAGCSGVILTAGCGDIYSAKVVRASMGSIFHLPVVQEIAYEDLISYCRRQGILLAATSLEQSNLYWDADLSGSLALVFGNEGNGVSQKLLDKSPLKVHIPLLGQAESLNVSAAAAVILYDAVRQRRVGL